MCCTWYREEAEIPKRGECEENPFVGGEWDISSSLDLVRCWKLFLCLFRNIYRKKEEKQSGIAIWASVESLSSGLHFKLVLVALKLAKISEKVLWAEVSTRRLWTLFRNSIKTIAERNCFQPKRTPGHWSPPNTKTDTIKKVWVSD